jgi:hypothetical protein
MSIFSDELTIMRRYLRDPDGNIWPYDDLLTYWNDAQREIALKAGMNERAESFPYPPEWTWSIAFPWEYAYSDGDRYQCLLNWDGEDATVCYPWEASYWTDTVAPADDGYRFVHPWEGFLAGPADYIPFPLHFDLHNIKYLAYDEGGLEPMDRKDISLNDSHYRTASGDPAGYWMPDSESRQAVLYPRPTSFDWDDGGLLQEPTETFDDAGGINTWSTDTTDEADAGVIVDAIPTENTVFILYQAVPRDVESMQDEIDIPPYLVKYVRYACLERAYGADTDGFIPSLRDYWKTRKEIGIRAIKKLEVLKRSDRDYRLGGGGRPAGSRHPRLPGEYPRQ